MPRGNGTGPAGMGPMTGRRLGTCAGSDEPGFMNDEMPLRGGRGFGRGPGWGNGRGFGCGFGRGFGNGFGNGFGPGRGRGFAATPPWTAPPTPADELQPLAEQVVKLRNQLAALEVRLAAANDQDD